MDVPDAVTVARLRPLWRRILKWFLWTLAGVVALLLGLALTAFVLWRTGQVTKWFAHNQSLKIEAVAPTERPWPPPGTPPGTEPPDTLPGPRRSAATVLRPADFFVRTQIWEVELAFTAADWKRIQPTGHVPSMDFNRPDGKFPLRNPDAPRNGLAGVIGIGQPWSEARVRVGGVDFEATAVRFKGNGTFLNSFAAFKRPFKIDLAKNHPGRRLAGFDVLNLNNLISDFSSLSDAMGYRLYREAGVPAPRTAYARVRLGIEGQFSRRPIGLYVLVENPDENWLREVMPGRNAALFKPVTYELFSDLGTHWSAYKDIYDPKTPLQDAHRRRVMAAANLVTHATDAEFATQAESFFDLPEIARFVAVTSALSSYDGFLYNGQNFLMYLDGPAGRFGFIPWDLDQAWGEFPLVGTVRQRETASIRKPWVADHRLLERLFALEPFRKQYEAEMARIRRDLFVPERLQSEVRELAALVRPTVAEESDYRLGRFDLAVAETWPENEPEPRIDDPFRPVHRIHRFIRRRAESLTAQLEGREPGHVFERRKMLGQP